MTKDIIEIFIDQWDEFVSFIPNLFGYVFRGQSDSRWTLKNSLERCLSKYNIPLHLASLKEYWALHEFKRKSHLYTNYHPQEDDNIEWLALMQHYGCPTRLLDFTSSPYIAAYFAIIESNTDSSIWALNELYLHERVRVDFNLPFSKGELLRDEINLEYLKIVNQFTGKDAWKNDKSFLIPVTPKKLTERISRQQGLFFFPTDASKSFTLNMAEAYSISSVNNYKRTTVRELSELDLSKVTSHPYIFKFNIPIKLHVDIIKHLLQMNITAESLFGGLDGLAKSLIQSKLRLF